MGELCTRIGYDHSTVTGLTDEPDFIKNMQTRWPYCIACVGQRNRQPPPPLHQHTHTRPIYAVVLHKSTSPLVQQYQCGVLHH
jgi:hypothetical protein